MSTRTALGVSRNTTRSMSPWITILTGGPLSLPPPPFPLPPPHAPRPPPPSPPPPPLPAHAPRGGRAAATPLWGEARGRARAPRGPRPPRPPGGRERAFGGGDPAPAPPPPGREALDEVE